MHFLVSQVTSHEAMSLRINLCIIKTLKWRHMLLLLGTLYTSRGALEWGVHTLALHQLCIGPLGALTPFLFFVFTLAFANLPLQAVGGKPHS